MKLKVRFKGGLASGHYGHRGRPGKRGGSLPGSLFETKYDTIGPTRVYHSTKTKAVISIIRHGLKRGGKWFGRKPSVYFTAKFEDVVRFAHNFESWSLDSDARIYAVVDFKLPDEVSADVIRDDQAIYDFSLDEAFRIEKDIPAEWVDSISVFKVGEHYNEAINEYEPVLLASISRHDWEGKSDDEIEAMMEYKLSGHTVEKSKSYYTFVIIDEDNRNVVEKQLPIDEASKVNLMKIRTSIFNDEVDTLAERMYTGEISIGQWEELMKKQIRELHSSVAAIGKGGWDLMTPADWGRLGPQMKEQYRYLHNFAQNIAENRDTISINAIKARAHMYGNAAGHSACMIEAGQVLSDMLPWLPKDGSTECLVNCKCRWELVVIDRVGDFNLVQATWRLGIAEHCDDCVKRDGYVHMMRVYKDIQIPKTIGGY